MTAPVVTTRIETQRAGTPGDVKLALAAGDALSVSAVTGRGEPVGNGFGLAILRAALRVTAATGQRLRQLEYLLRRALAALGGGIDH